MKLAFTNVPFRYNSAYIMIKKWLRFKRVITDTLVPKFHFSDKENQFSAEKFQFSVEKIQLIVKKFKFSAENF